MKVFGMIPATVAVLMALAQCQAQASVTVTQTTFRGLKAITLDCPTMSVVLLPEKGASIISVKDKRTGREWMWRNPYVDYKLPAYAANYMKYDVSGFDDCFPTVGASPYPDGPWKGIVLPDHGEVWSLPWDYTIGTEIPPGIIPGGMVPEVGQVRLSVHGIRLPYEFEKTVKLVEPNRLEISYKVANPTPMRMKAIWAGHALVAIEPGMEVFLPDSARFQESTKPWKTQTRNGLLWMKLGGPETESALKVYTRPLDQGFGGFRDPKTGDFYAMLFSPRQIPYIGLWINQGLKLDDKNPHYNAGIEPTNGGEDYKFSETRKMLQEIRPKSNWEWDLTILVGRSSEEGLLEKLTSQ